MHNFPLPQMIRPDYITSREHHSACVFGSGPNFRLVVLFGGSNDKNESFAETTLLTLGMYQKEKSEGLGTLEKGCFGVE